MSGITVSIAPEGQLRYGNYISRTGLLGPGERFVLWVQGCFAGCRGCVAEEFQYPDRGKLIAITELAALIAGDAGTEGITISGGEPFLQADRVCELVKLVKRTRPEMSLMLYTGFTYEELQGSGEESVTELLSLADVLIDGRYTEELNDDAGLRGSSNQRIIHLTDRYRGSGELDPGGARTGTFVTMNGRMFMVGVPNKETERLHRTLKVMYPFPPQDKNDNGENL